MPYMPHHEPRFQTRRSGPRQRGPILPQASRAAQRIPRANIGCPKQVLRCRYAARVPQIAAPATATPTTFAQIRVNNC